MDNGQWTIRYVLLVRDVGFADLYGADPKRYPYTIIKAEHIPVRFIA